MSHLINGIYFEIVNVSPKDNYMHAIFRFLNPLTNDYSRYKFIQHNNDILISLEVTTGKWEDFVIKPENLNRELRKILPPDKGWTEEMFKLAIVAYDAGNQDGYAEAIAS